MNPLFYGKIENGKLILDNQEGFNGHLISLSGKPVVVSVKRNSPIKNRTVKENAYYWGVVVKLIGEHLGYLPNEVHDALKWKFLRREGLKLDRLLSTAVLDTIDFEEYLSNIRQWAGQDLEMIIPLPNEVE